MLIRCKKPPRDYAWVEPKRRFIFKDGQVYDLDDYGVKTLQKKLGAKFSEVFELVTAKPETVKAETVSPFAKYKRGNK